MLHNQHPSDSNDLTVPCKAPNQCFRTLDLFLDIFCSCLEGNGNGHLMGYPAASDVWSTAVVPSLRVVHACLCRLIAMTT